MDFEVLINLSCSQFNPIKKLQVYFTSRTLALTSSHKFEFNKSLYKFPLQAFNLYLQWYFIEGWVDSGEATGMKKLTSSTFNETLVDTHGVGGLGISST